MIQQFIIFMNQRGVLAVFMVRIVKRVSQARDANYIGTLVLRMSKPKFGFSEVIINC